MSLVASDRAKTTRFWTSDFTRVYLRTMTSERIDIPISAHYGLVTLHGTGNGTGAGNRIRTIGNNGSWSLSLSGTWTFLHDIRTHWSFSRSLSLYRSRCGAVWISHCRSNILKRCHFPVHIRGIYKCMSLDCAVHHLIWTVQPRRHTGIGQV